MGILATHEGSIDEKRPLRAESRTGIISKFAQGIETKPPNGDQASGGDYHEDGTHCQCLAIVQQSRLCKRAIDYDGHCWRVGPAHQQGGAKFTEADGEGEGGTDQNCAKEDGQINLQPAVEGRRSQNRGRLAQSAGRDCAMWARAYEGQTVQR